MHTSGFDEYVGLTALENVSQRFCRCQEDIFGPICDKKLYQFKEMANCGKHGVFDSRNTITGCSCRDSVHGSATEYHGWYCERHNRYYIKNGSNETKNIEEEFQDIKSNLCLFNTETDLYFFIEQYSS